MVQKVGGICVGLSFASAGPITNAEINRVTTVKTKCLSFTVKHYLFEYGIAIGAPGGTKLGTENPSLTSLMATPRKTVQEIQYEIESLFQNDLVLGAIGYGLCVTIET